MIVRIGIPASFGRLCGAAAEIGAPILISANALRRKGRPFSRPAPGLFAYCDAALDSAGFVAMVRYGGYPWTVAEFVRLAGAHPWAWWASMDYCCEPQIAGDPDEVRRRIEATAAKLVECRAEADVQAVPHPMPVLQGWTPDDYRRSIELTAATGNLPPLLGLGSVCRRPLHGPAGIPAILRAVDRDLPRGIGLHLFGVKGSAIAALAGHPRITSVDSMAWDYAARRDADGSCTLDHRIDHMRRWYAAQRTPLDGDLFGRAA